MPRNMSFFYTQDQIRNRTKTVTRRLGWNFLKEGELVFAVEKAQGLGKGGKIVKICPIKIVSTRMERLNEITKKECILEGFPEMEPEDFIDMFIRHMHLNNQWGMVNRIEFKYL